jgi:hypothetical protein
MLILQPSCFTAVRPVGRGNSPPHLSAHPKSSPVKRDLAMVESAGSEDGTHNLYKTANKLRPLTLIRPANSSIGAP